MYSPFEPVFWIFFLYFFLAIIIAFFIPGNLFIRKLKVTLFPEIVLSIVFGFVIWCFQGFLFGYLQMRFLTYLYLLVALLAWLFFYSQMFLKKVKFKKPDVTIVALLIIGTAIQLSSIWLNGVAFKNGLYFCCGVPDTVYHLALTSVLVTQFPPREPGISGVVLQNYHYLSNLGIADLVRIFRLPLINTQYQYMTVVLSLLLGLTPLVLATILNFSKKAKLWLLFLIYFCGDIIFLLSFLNGKGFNFGYTTLENASSLWVSPARVFAIVVFFAGLSLLALWLKKKDIFTGILMGVVFASLIGMKIYVGGIMLAGLGALGIIYLFKKEYRMLLPILVFYLVSVALFLPVNSKSGGFFFSGFWRFEDFIVQPSLGLSHLELARRIYADGHNVLRVLMYDLYFGFLYIVFSSGILLLGFFQTKGSLKSLPKYFTLTLSIGLLASCVAGFFFLQKTGSANSSQFLISIYVIGTIYSAIAIYWWLNKQTRKVAIIFGLIVIALASFKVIHDTVIRVSRISNSTEPLVSRSSLESYRYFTKTKTYQTVLTYEEGSLDCLFIRIISSSSAYACESGAPGDRGVNLTERIVVRKMIFYGKDLEKSKSALKENKISYIYMPKMEVKKSNIGKMSLSKAYENNTIVIYKVVK